MLGTKGDKMETIVKKIDEKVMQYDTEEYLCEFSEAAQILRKGGLVAFPTETVYGLGGDALNKDASMKIYGAKGRPSDNPLIVHICDVDALNELCVEIPDDAWKLAKRFWPGPLTMILKKSDKVPSQTTGGLDTVAVRFPNHPVALGLLKESGVYIAAPSANTSGKPSPTLASHVEHDLGGKIEYIIDGGEVGIGIESTIIDLTSEVPTILRPGYITKKMLLEVLDNVEYDKAILIENKDKGLAPKAPGMKYKHYAPRAELTIVEGNVQDVIEKINTLVKNMWHEGISCGIIATTQTKDKYVCDNIRVVGSRDDELSISKGLYKTLREFDEMNVEYIYTESFSNDEFGTSIMNRLLKAAGYNIIHV